MADPFPDSLQWSLLDALDTLALEVQQSRLREGNSHSRPLCPAPRGEWPARERPHTESDFAQQDKHALRRS